MMRRHSKFSVAVYDSGYAEVEPRMLEETDELVWRPSYQLTAFGINVGGERLNFSQSWATVVPESLTWASESACEHVTTLRFLRSRFVT